MRFIRNFVWFIRHGRERLESAWARIEQLERRLSEAEAAMSAREKDAQQQFEDLRRLFLAAREERKPAAIQARNWREVKNLMEGTEDAQG